MFVYTFVFIFFNSILNVSKIDWITAQVKKRNKK